ncbi:hypothetical protein PINS_up022778 [Pythium insidiosum]|nr:hypothetical protein PINS_up022778 [Pythium insidiosum]
MPLAELLAPAIALAKDGFPVSPITAHGWARGKHQLDRSPHGHELLLHGERVAWPRRSVEAVALQGGVLTLEDLAAHASTVVTPIKTTFRGVDVHEIPPNGQGIVALLALNILNELLPEGADDSTVARDSPEYLISWSRRCVSRSPTRSGTREYARARAALIDRSRALVDPTRGSPELSCDTVSFQVVDAAGNAVSMVNSNYEGFGTGFVPRGCGFTLQNRGSNFRSTTLDTRTRWPPCKRPYHTIIPAISTFADDSQALHATFSVMGAFMQPQGHVQVLCNLLVHGLDPQEAIDAPRVCVDAKSGATGESRVLLEDGVSPETAHALATRFGHVIETRAGVGPRSVFGRGQIIVRDRESGVLCAGSDGRADGCAMGW